MRTILVAALALLLIAASTGQASAQDAAQLVALLKSPEPTARVNALVRLSQMGGGAEPALPGMLDALRDPDPAVRMYAAKAFGQSRVKPDVSVSALFPVLGDAEAVVRCAAAEALGSLQHQPEAIVPALLPACNDAEYRVRMAVFRALQMARDQKVSPEVQQQVVAALLKGLEDPSQLARAGAAQGLQWNWPGEAAFGPLVRALADADLNVRTNAVAALASQGPESISQLEEVAKLLRDPERQVRQRAAEALRAIDAEAGLKKLGETLREGDEMVRATAAEALGGWPFSEAVTPLLQQAAKDGSAEVRYRAMVAIERQGERAVATLPTVTEALVDRNYLVRIQAAGTLTKLGPTAVSAVPALATASQKDWHAGVRNAATSAMIQLTTPAKQ